MKALFGGGDGGNAKYTLPPFPHPLPERSLSLHCTPGGLFIIPTRPAHKVNTTGSFRQHHSPRTSITSVTEDVASDASLASRRDAALESMGAKLSWGRDGKVQAASSAELKRVTREDEILCYGVVGIQRLFNHAYLLVVTSRTFAGDYLHTSRPVYKSTGVLVIPLSHARAKDVFKVESHRQQKRLADLVKKGKLGLSQELGDDEKDDGEEDDVVTPSVISRDGFFESETGSRLVSATLKPNRSGPWLQRSARHASDGGDLTGPQGSAKEVDEPSSLPDSAAVEAQASAAPHLSADEQWHEATKAELEEKVVKETARQYARGEMWFTYDFDLTTPLQRKQDNLELGGKAKSAAALLASKGGVQGQTPFAEPSPTLPLWRRADSRFWHNEHISKAFVEAGLHALVLPMMQGYFQVTTLPLNLDQTSPSDDGVDAAGDAMDAVSEAASSLRTEAQLLVISRRSKERAGLRYQRRGVNEQGQVANYVESEQILYVKRGDNEHHVLSFLQFRGSIPQYWKQDPFSMKPPPMLERSAAENKTACAKHFEAQLVKYGKVICVNLAEQHGKEGAITKAYKEAIEGLGTDKVQYKAFDFHEECKGMKFENVNKLLDEVKDDELKEMDCFWKGVGGAYQREEVFSRQHSAFRVSCLDCLDRTNVVQSAFARYMLTTQLQRLGIHRQDVRDEDFDFAFNDSWANNGDMVSQIYAGTRALKGDFTRTGKRNLMGMMNDATNSVYRMVQGAVTDFFKQTVIDFQYGQTSLAALERYNDDLAAQDPSESHRLARVRGNAIETCAKDLVAKEEEVIAGWTLFSPIEPNRIESPKLEEKVVLLTAKAIYVCGYDFTAEKLVEYSKIKLGDVVGLRRGVYILSPNEGYHPENHWGLVVEYLAEERRLNTASMRNVPPKQDSHATTNFVAFRAVVDDFAPSPSTAASASVSSEARGAAAATAATGRWNLFGRRASGGGGGGALADAEDFQRPRSSHALVDQIVAALIKQCADAGACEEDGSSFVKEETIQSLAQARANASLFAPLIEGLKRRLWL